MHKLKPTKQFKKELEKLIKSGRLAKSKFKNFAITLSKNPFEQKLKTHKVQSKLQGKKYSSRIDGDLRVIWDFDKEENIAILLLDIGGHFGKHGVY